MEILAHKNFFQDIGTSDLQSQKHFLKMQVEQKELLFEKKKKLKTLKPKQNTPKTIIHSQILSISGE